MEQTILKQYATTFLRSFHSGSIGRKQCFETITLKHHIETSDLSDSDGDTDYAVCTLNIEEDEQSPQSISNKVHATMLVCEQEVTFQLDSGATCNILPSSTIPSLPPLQPLGKYI